jgi:hypothetical protein
MPDQQPIKHLELVQHCLEEQLDQRVDEVVDAKPAREESTKELIHLEETLSTAQHRAKQLVTVRRKLDDQLGEAADVGREPAAGPEGEPPRA